MHSYKCPEDGRAHACVCLCLCLIRRQLGSPSIMFVHWTTTRRDELQNDVDVASPHQHTHGHVFFFFFVLFWLLMMLPLLYPSFHCVARMKTKERARHLSSSLLVWVITFRRPAWSAAHETRKYDNGAGVKQIIHHLLRSRFPCKS